MGLYLTPQNKKRYNKNKVYEKYKNSYMINYLNSIYNGKHFQRLPIKTQRKKFYQKFSEIKLDTPDYPIILAMK